MTVKQLQKKYMVRKRNERLFVVKCIDNVVELTKNNTDGVLNVCLNYGGRREIVDAVNKIKEANLSNIESIMYAYDILKKRLYKLDEENYYKSSDVSSVLTGDSNVFNAFLKCLNIKAAPLISKEAKHQRSIIYVQDEKYNIDGVYVFDPTWDRRKNKEDKEYINRYNYFAIPLSVSNETAKDELYKALTIEPCDYLESRSKLDIEEMRKCVNQLQ